MRSASEQKQAENRARRQKELQQLVPITFDQLQEVVNKWILIEDFGVLRFHTAVPLMHLYGKTTAWTFLVGPSGGGKTLLLDSFEDLECCHFLSSLTPQTFISGFRGGEQMLDRLEGKIVVFKDWTTMLSMPFEGRSQIMAQLREIYDGKFVKGFGTNEEKSWQGRITLYAGVTEMIDQQQQSFASLGERFLYYRILMPNREEAALRSLKNNIHKDKMKKEIKNAFFAYYKGMALKNINIDYELSDEKQREIVKIANFVSTARSSVIREFNHQKEIVFVPQAEMPTRISEQLDIVLRGLTAVRGSKEIHNDDMKIIYKIAFDSVPKINRKILRCLAASHQLVSDEVATSIDLPAHITLIILQNLNMLGVIKRIKGKESIEGGAKDRWEIHPDFREILIKYDNVEPYIIEDSPELTAIKAGFGDHIIDVKNFQEEITFN